MDKHRSENRILYRLAQYPSRHPGFETFTGYRVPDQSPTLSCRSPDFTSFHRGSALFYIHGDLYAIQSETTVQISRLSQSDGPRLLRGAYITGALREHYRRDPDTKKRYDSRWRKIRALYVKAHPLCEECLKHGRTTPVEQVHHIVPLADGGTHDFSNLMSLCKSCHSAITMAETNRKARER